MRCPLPQTGLRPPKMPHQLSPHDTALVLVCTQHMSLAAAPYSWDSVIPLSSDTIAIFRDAGVPVFFVDITSSTSRRQQDSTSSASPSPEPALSFETLIQPNDVLITQRQWSTFYGASLDQLDTWGAFLGTDLSLQLHRHKISTIVFGGTAANGQLEITAQTAKKLGRKIILLKDLITDFDDPKDQDSFSQNLSEIGQITLSTTLKFCR